MDGVALRPLTVDFHEPGLVGTLNSEGAHADKLHWGGPVNPQSLNRYSYVQNNPVGKTDPSGHIWCQKEWCGLKELWQNVKGGWDKFWKSVNQEMAKRAFEDGVPIQVVGELGNFIVDPKKLFGRNLHNIDQIDSGRLKGFGRGITDLNGGDKGARDAFEVLTGQKAVGDMVRWVDPAGNFEVLFRSAAKSGSKIPTVEVINFVDRFLEKIKFHP